MEQQPKYAPKVWLQFKITEEVQVIGQVVGLQNDGEGWFYHVANPTVPSGVYYVPETDVIRQI